MPRTLLNLDFDELLPKLVAEFWPAVRDDVEGAPENAVSTPRPATLSAPRTFRPNERTEHRPSLLLYSLGSEIFFRVRIVYVKSQFSKGKQIICMLSVPYWSESEYSGRGANSRSPRLQGPLECQLLYRCLVVCQPLIAEVFVDLGLF